MHAVRRMPRTPLQRAAIGAFLYVVAGALWIAFSNALLHDWVRDRRLIEQAQTWKGWFFVAVSGALLFAVLYRLLRRDTRLLRDHMKQREELHALNQFRESVIDHASMWINVLDASARVTLWNRAAERISGYPREEVIGRQDIWERLYPDPDYRASITARYAEILAKGVEVDQLETRIRCHDGQEKVIAWSVRRFRSGNGEAGSITIGRNITEHKQMQQMLRARDQQLAILMANVPGMVYRRRCNVGWTLRFVSSGCLDLTGYTADDLIDDRGVTYASLVHPDDRERIREHTRKAARANQPFTLEYRIVHRSGQHRWVWEQGRAVHTEDGQHLEGIIVNITDRKRMERQLEQLAIQDPLTGLHNRREMQLALEQKVREAERARQPLTLLWLDVDNFKTINDGHGHLIGDQVLRRLAQVIRDHLRPEDMAARMGGDEFVVLLPGMDSRPARRLAETLHQAIRAIRVPLQDEDALSLTVSIGLASLFEHAGDAASLSDTADQAMYEAKDAGRDRICCAPALNPERMPGLSGNIPAPPSTSSPRESGPPSGS